METALDTRGISITPSYWSKWRAFVAGRKALSVANFTDRLAEVYGERTLFLLDRPLEAPYFRGNVISHREMNRLVRRAASVLQSLGVKRGDRIALATLNRIELAFVEFGAQRLGAIPVPLNFMLTVDEIRQIVERCGAKMLVTDRTVFEKNIRERSRLPSIEQWMMVTSQAVPEGFESFDARMEAATEDVEPVEVGDEEAALIFFTAGTTGTPKGAVLTSGGLMDSFRRYARLASILPTPKRRLALLVMPMAHTSGHQHLLVQMALGTPCLLMGSFDPERILDHIEKYRVSLFAGIPTMYRMLLDSGAEQRDLSSVRLWGGGGDAFPHDLVQKFRGMSRRGLFKRKAAFITGYGLAETAGQVSITLPFALGDNCIGWLMPGVQARLVDAEGKDVPDGDVGELILRTPGLMQGYWNDPEGTKTALRDGWFYTGDLMRKGKWGLKYFVSREKEMIKVGGYSVFPAEVEKVLDSHPDVERSVVVGLPHPTKGELPVAGVVTGAGSRLTEHDLELWISERVAPYRCPRRVVFIEEIPQNFSMKPLRRLVRDRLIEQGIKVEARSDRERKRVVAS